MGRLGTGRYQKPDYQALRYHSVPKTKPTVDSLDEIDPAMRDAWDRLGIPIGEQARRPGSASAAYMPWRCCACTQQTWAARHPPSLLAEGDRSRTQDAGWSYNNEVSTC